jgi:hypothetical protein
MQSGLPLTCSAPRKNFLCGVALDPAYIAQLETTFAPRSSHRPKQPVADPQSVGYGVDWDENFAYIAGRTEAGFPYGITWEELEADSTAEERVTSPSVVEDDEF